MNIHFPFQFDSRGRTADATNEQHIRNMTEQFLFTNAGERVNRPNFGSGLLQLIFSPNSPELASTLQMSAQGGLQQWLGDLVEVMALTATSEDSTLRLEVQYRIRQTQEVRRESFTRSAPL